MEVFNILWNKYNEEKQYLIGYLIYDQEWLFKYNEKMIEDAINKGFRPFLEFPLINKIYTEKRLFKTFKNRLKITNQKLELKSLKEKQGKLITDNIIILYRKTN